MKKRTKEILLVEDNPDDVMLAKRAFIKSEVDCKLEVKTDGVIALEYLHEIVKAKEHKESYSFPSLVLLDINLPRMNGIEFLEQVKTDKQLNFIPIVILTTSREERDITACYNAGANSYIRKTVDYKEFIETVRLLGTYWLTLNETPPQMSGGY